MEQLPSQSQIRRLIVMMEDNTTEEQATALASGVGIVRGQAKCQEGYVFLVETDASFTIGEPTSEVANEN